MGQTSGGSAGNLELLKKIETLENYIKTHIDNPEMHRNIFRGKNLGTTFTSEQKAAISNGTFEDLYVGDYWKIDGKTWRIVDINYWLNTGDISCTMPHLVIMPDAMLYNAKMNETNTTNGGYTGSEMYKVGLNSAKNTVNLLFGENYILNHREMLSNAVTNGHPSGGGWYDSTVEIPSEIMMYGTHIFSSVGDGTFTTAGYTIDKTQLALLQLYPKFINQNKQSQWLRDIVSDSHFSSFHFYGNADYRGASDNLGVRPVFGLIG